ncbi:GrpB family protein [Mucilaginibacter sabulilitoris]|uniref:GrpB family protein n=1 Tax=Mucilaginibacter sabulilitoris TaxID=1173583 RepID=A0ABZ0TXV3_9SPHI|nr:GrpB family protein [Mucilaginibacter sabulilitoris]WPU96649.1 GrpB family protein [Mucilaginibacter sabulilitoris]
MTTPGIIDEKITVSDYNPQWPELFKEEAFEIHNVLSPVKFKLEHIGSTAVIGLSAKPVVDIMLGPTSWKSLPEIKSGLIALGYEYLGEAGVPGREYFRKRRAQAFNVHIMLSDSELWRNNILLRDYLLSQPEAAKKYAQIKEEAIAQRIDTLIAYSNHKTQFIAALLTEARTAVTKQAPL